MIDLPWIQTSWQAIWMVLLSTILIYLCLISLTRLAGLRSFSKLSSFDFAMTVAIGSVIAGTVMAEDPALLQGVAALGAIYGIQMLAAALRKRSSLAQRWVDNQPLLLMAGGEIIEEHMRAAHMTRTDLMAKLREANVLHLDEVRAVVLESTGDVSVLHGDPDGRPLDSTLLEEVRGRDRMA